VHVTDRSPATHGQPNGFLTALYLGVFAAAWFSWGDATAPDALSGLLRVGAWLALAVAVTGLVSAILRRSATPTPRDRAADRRYLLIVIIEFAVAGIGASVLNASDHAAYTPAFVGVVVGLHFLPLVKILHDPLLTVLGVAVTVVAVVAAVVQAATDTAAATVAGTGIGALLLAFAVYRLISSWIRVRADAANTPVRAR
jgi:hypothetical protein